MSLLAIFSIDAHQAVLYPSRAQGLQPYYTHPGLRVCNVQQIIVGL